MSQFGILSLHFLDPLFFNLGFSDFAFLQLDEIGSVPEVRFQGLLLQSDFETLDVPAIPIPDSIEVEESTVGAIELGNRLASLVDGTFKVVGGSV